MNDGSALSGTYTLTNASAIVQITDLLQTKKYTIKQMVELQSLV